MAAGGPATTTPSFSSAGQALAAQLLAQMLGFNVDSAKKTLKSFAKREGLSVDDAYKNLSRQHHPDRRHDELFDYTAIMQNLNAARDALAGGDRCGNGSSGLGRGRRTDCASDSDDSDDDAADGHVPRLAGGEPLSAKLRRDRKATTTALLSEGLQGLHLLNVWPVIRPHLATLLEDEREVHEALRFACPVVPCAHISASPHDRRVHVLEHHTRLELEVAGRLLAAREEVAALAAELGYDSPKEFKKAASHIRLQQLPVDAGMLLLVGMAVSKAGSAEVDTADAELSLLRAGVQHLGSQLDQDLQCVAAAETTLPQTPAARIEMVGLYAWSAGSKAKVAAILQCPDATLLPKVALVGGEPVPCDGLSMSETAEISHPHLGRYAPVRTTAEEGGRYALRAARSLLNAALASLRAGMAGVVMRAGEGSPHLPTVLAGSYPARCIALAAATCERLTAPANERADAFADFAHRWTAAAVEGNAPEVSQAGSDSVATLKRVATLAALALEVGSCRPEQWRRVLQALLRATAGAGAGTGASASAEAPPPRVDVAAPALVLRAFATLSTIPEASISAVEMRLLQPSDMELRSDDGPAACLAAALCLAALQCNHGVLDAQATTTALARLVRALVDNAKAKAPLGPTGAQQTATALDTAASAIRIVAGAFAALDNDASGPAAKASRLVDAAHSAWLKEHDGHAALTLLLASKFFVADAFPGLSEEEIPTVLPWLAASSTEDGLEELWRLVAVDLAIAGMSATDVSSDQARRPQFWKALANGFEIAGDKGLAALAVKNTRNRDTHSAPSALAGELLGAWGLGNARHLCQRLVDTALGVADDAALTGVSLFVTRARQGDFSSRSVARQALVFAAEATLQLLQAGGATEAEQAAAACGAAQLGNAVMLLPLQPMIQLGAVLTGDGSLHGGLTAALRAETPEAMATGCWSGTATQAPPQLGRPPVRFLPRGFRRAERHGLQRRGTTDATEAADVYFDLGQAAEDGSLTLACLFLGTHCLMAAAEAAVEQGTVDTPSDAAATAATAWQALWLCGDLMKLVETHVPTVDLLALRHYFALLERSQGVFSKLSALRLCAGNSGIPSLRPHSVLPPADASERRQAMLKALTWAALRRLKRQQAVFPAMMPQAVSRTACDAGAYERKHEQPPSAAAGSAAAGSAAAGSPPPGRHSNSPLEMLMLRLYAWTQLGRDALELQQAQLLAQARSGHGHEHEPLGRSGLASALAAPATVPVRPSAVPRHSQRILALDAALQQRGLSAADVVACCDSPAVPRGRDGFLLPPPADATASADLDLGLPVAAVSFLCAGGVDAIVISPHGTKEWRCELVGRSGSGSGRAGTAGQGRALLCPEDVAQVLGLHGAPLATFTLDPEMAQASHSLHEMHYVPRTLKGNVLLDAMAQCDWLLKMLTVGVEVAAQPPFALRSASNNLLARLPEGLRNKLSALYARDIEPGARRFWVEQGVAIGDVELREDGSAVLKVAKALPFAVRTRAMIVNEKGELQDVQSDTNDDTSVGAEIAALLTAEFEALCSALPIFARLRELSRLLVLGNILRQSSDKVLQDPNSRLSPGLKGAVRDQCYPRAIRSDVERRLAVLNNISGKDALPAQQWPEWEKLVTSSLRQDQEKDDNDVRDLSHYFARLLWMSRTNAEDLARKCLRERSLEPFDIAGRERGTFLQIWLLTWLGMDLSVKVADLYDVPLRDPQSKSEVMPAVFSHRNGRMIVGGVSLGSIEQPKQGSLSSTGGPDDDDPCGPKRTSTPFKSQKGMARIKAEFKKQMMNDSKQPRHVRSWLKQEFKRTGSWYRVHNPRGYDIDHTRNDVNFCRFQYSRDNRARGGKNSIFEKLRTLFGLPRR